MFADDFYFLAQRVFSKIYNFLLANFLEANGARENAAI